MRARNAFKPETAQAAWAVACRLGTFGYAEISSELKIDHKRATAIVQSWVAEHAAFPEDTDSKRRMFRADPDFVRREIVSRSPEDNMWFAMRKLRSFSATDIAAHASTPEVPVDRLTAHGYLQFLLAAGYLRVSRRAAPGMKREAQYTLARETGPRPPVPRRVRAIHDPNTGETRILREAE